MLKTLVIALLLLPVGIANAEDKPKAAPNKSAKAPVKLSDAEIRKRLKDKNADVDIEEEVTTLDQALKAALKSAELEYQLAEGIKGDQKLGFSFMLSEIPIETVLAMILEELEYQWEPKEGKVRISKAPAPDPKSPKNLTARQIRKRMEETTATFQFKNKPLKDAIAELAKSAVVVIELDKAVDSKQAVELDMKGTAMAALKAILVSTGLEWEIQKGKIVVKKASEEK